MKIKKEKAIFICQVTENSLKVIKCLRISNSKPQFVGLEVETIAADIDTQKLAQTLSQVLKKLEYNNQPLIISLPRQNATCRFLKVPSSIPEEIERIISLQAPRYLPYAIGELITGYQVISTDKGGYSDINLALAHKDVIVRLVNILRELKIKNFKITPSSYGLCNLYSYIESGQTQPVIVIDIDFPQVELVITGQDKLLFSRSFKISPEAKDWQPLLVEEINKSLDAYSKDVQKQAPSRLIIFGSPKNSQMAQDILSKGINLPISVLPYWEKVSAAKSFIHNILNVDTSFAGLIGLGLKEVPAQLNLLPPEMKEIAKRQSQQKETWKLILSLSAILLCLILGAFKNLNNKTGYLKQLKLELGKIEKEARPLEELEKRFKFMESHLQKKPSGLDMLYELHQAIPEQISLSNFSYEEDKLVVLRGQTRELNYVFAFVPQLEKSAAFKDFNIKVRYATQKKTQSGEVVDFEIICLKK